MNRQKKAAKREELSGQVVTSGDAYVADCTSTQGAGTQGIPHFTGFRTKKARILYHLTLVGSLNRFQAQNLGDTTLNSTISALTNEHGVVFDRVSEKVPNRFGSKTRVTRYKVTSSSIDKAVALLRHWEVPHD